MTWNKNPKPKSIGWYLCTVEDKCGNRFVMPVHCSEYPKDNFYWDALAYNLKVVAYIKFPKPYEGEII